MLIIKHRFLNQTNAPSIQQAKSFGDLDTALNATLTPICSKAKLSQSSRQRPGESNIMAWSMAQ